MYIADLTICFNNDSIGARQISSKYKEDLETKVGEIVSRVINESRDTNNPVKYHRVKVWKENDTTTV